MILHSAAIIIAPGGSGSEWEIFQILESVKSDQLKAVPIYLVGENGIE
ncbi:MAG: LOG family protein [Nitrospirae bacterium]|nr:LOG family protein [Nitrospirota bacterium]